MLGIIGAAAVLAALLVLPLPLSLQAVDRTGLPIACGTAFHPDYDFAAREDALNKDLHSSFGAFYVPSDYENQCAAIVATRRGIAYSVLVGGGVLLGAAFLLSLHAAGYVDLSRERFRMASKQRATPVLIPKSSPSTMRYYDDLDLVRMSLGIRVQH
ncbi:hypothetical protein [Mycobacterium bourgelatii]|uniref:hypothetical protein n=1 Tax=Mycobacterium bourgelatii TaxID=1273442 RepID=UPI0013D1DD02|nr:hypothetical protein [Mycobacterium bourgelatii]MCV6976891.1 hypothetical protein [Mycobacterium bourgelatii]